MANPEDLETLCQGPKVWNAWRAENAERVPDLRGARLTLSQRQFGVNHGGPIDLSRCDLEGAELRHANLAGADLHYARLVAADLVHAQLGDTDLAGADLTDAVLDYADLTGADLDGTILVGASLANVKGLTEEQIAAAHGDASTVLPAMLLPPQHWYPPLDDDMFGGSPAPDSIHNSDPYEVLRVARTATQDEIRAAFRHLVKVYHPDINPDDAEAQEIFKRVSIAYRILGDADKRARFDRGEIGGDGEVSPEYEAKQHFRRHAYRIYAAAAASLVIAIGALAAVWYVVLTNDASPDRRVRIAVAAPPKLDERLPAPDSLPVGADTDRLNVKQLDEDAEAFLNSGNEPEEVQQPETKAEEPPAAPTQVASEAPVETQAPKGEPSAPVSGTAENAQPATPPAKSQQIAALPETSESPSTAESTTANNTSPPPAKAAAQTTEPQAETSNTAESTTAGSTPPPPAEAAPQTAEPQAGTPSTGSTPPPPAEAADPKTAEPQAGTPSTAESTAAGSTPPPPAEAAGPQTAELQAGTPSTAEGTPAGSTAPPSAEAALPPVAEQPPAVSGDITPPLGDQHSVTEAGPAQADPARTVAPGETEGGKTGSLPADGSTSRSIVAKAGPGYSPHSDLLRVTMGRKIGNDPVAAMLWTIVIETKAAPKRDQTTGSVGPLLARGNVSDDDEVFDVYQHAIPENPADQDRGWQGLLKAGNRQVERKAGAQKRTAVSVPAEVTAGNTAPPEPSPGAAFRERAISDVLAGGL